MSRIEIDYDGRRITYAENEDVWRCWDMELEAETLTKLKAKINAEDRKARSLDSVPILYMANYDIKPTEAVATTLDVRGRQVFVSFGKDNAAGKRERQKVGLDNVYPDDQETRDKIAEYGRLETIAREAASVAKAYRDGIARLDIEKLAPAAVEAVDTTPRRRRRR